MNQANTYDIINAGPRHRFTANGKIVSNCGRMFQPQNLPRPSVSHEDILLGIEAIKGGFVHYADYFDVMKLASSALRYAICAETGKKLVISDLSNIEGRVLAWLAGEEWKLEAFRMFDKKLGPDIYVAAYAKTFRVPQSEVDDKKRQVGKVQELAFGFAGAVGAFVAFAPAGKIDLSKFPAAVLPTVPDDIRAEAEKFYDWRVDQDVKKAKDKAAKDATGATKWKEVYEAKGTYGLEREVYITIECVKRLWRRDHPAICEFWKLAENACRSASMVSKRKFHFGKCYAIKSGNWVKVVLPGGHVLCYPDMQVDSENRLWYWGMDQYTKKWSKIFTTGGKITENCTQACARDVFKYGQLEAEKRGYSVVLVVHDELVCEVPDNDTYTVKELESIMATVPDWAEGLPLAAKGHASYRYHKD